MKSPSACGGDLGLRGHRARVRVLGSVLGAWLLLGIIGCGDGQILPQDSHIGVSDIPVMTTDVPLDSTIATDTSPDPDSLDGASSGDIPVDTQPADGLQDTAEPMPDTSEPVEDTATGMTPTWWECRVSMLKDLLSPADEAVCDTLHTEAPASHIFGIRWVFLDPSVDTEAWIGPRLHVLNNLFKPTEMSFMTTSQVTVMKSIIIDPGLDDTFTLEELTANTASQLEIPATSSGEVLAALKAQLLGAGVQKNKLDELTVATPFNAKQYLAMLARARPEEIHVIVTPFLNGQAGGGVSSGPGTNPTSRQVSTVIIRSPETVSHMVLAHEMGHYFGLTHPHVRLEEPAEVASASLNQLVPNQPFDLGELLTSLKTHLGDDLTGDIPPLYPVWNGKQKDVIKPFEHLRYGVSKVWIIRFRMYKEGIMGPEPFSDLKSFLAAAEAGETLYYKNFTAPGQGNNCGWDDVEEMFTCDVGSPPSKVLGTSPLLDGTLVFDIGQFVNVMSYIGKTLPPEELVDRVRFPDYAVPVLRLHANTPMRLMLRNHAL